MKPEATSSHNPKPKVPNPIPDSWSRIDKNEDIDTDIKDVSI